MIVLLLSCILGLSGCKSIPKTDKHAAHVGGLTLAKIDSFDSGIHNQASANNPKYYQLNAKALDADTVKVFTTYFAALKENFYEAAYIDYRIADYLGDKRAKEKIDYLKQTLQPETIRIAERKFSLILRPTSPGIQLIKDRYEVPAQFRRDPQK